MASIGNQLLFSGNAFEEPKSLSKKLVVRIFNNLGITNNIYLIRYQKLITKLHPNYTKIQVIQKTAHDRRYLLESNRIPLKLVAQILFALGYAVIESEFDETYAFLSMLKIHTPENGYMRYAETRNIMIIDKNGIPHVGKEVLSRK